MERSRGSVRLIWPVVITAVVIVPLLILAWWRSGGTEVHGDPSGRRALGATGPLYPPCGGRWRQDGHLFLTDRIKDMVVSWRRERLPGRGRGGAGPPSRRRRCRGHRRARRSLGRVREGAGRPRARRDADRRGSDRLRARPARRLQAAAVGRARGRAAADAL